MQTEGDNTFHRAAVVTDVEVLAEDRDYGRGVANSLKMHHGEATNSTFVK